MVDQGQAPAALEKHHLSEAEWVSLLASTAQMDQGAIVLGLAGADDAACVRFPPGAEDRQKPLLAASADSVVEGVHFPPDAPSWWLAQRILRASISDLYAVGALPEYILMNVVDKSLENQYYREFLENISSLMREEGVRLIGGNTCAGEQRQIHMTALGSLLSGQVTRRSGARDGDLIVLSGPTGFFAQARKQWEWPKMVLPCLGPWLEAVRNCASACIDVSDGLAGDLARLCRASGVGARLWADHLGRSQSSPEIPELDECLLGGEDYVLCCSIAEEHLNRPEFDGLSPLVIGRIAAGQGVCLYQDREESHLIRDLKPETAFDHFGPG